MDTYEQAKKLILERLRDAGGIASGEVFKGVPHKKALCHEGVATKVSALVINDGHLSLPLAPQGIFSDQGGHEVSHVDAACLARVEDGASGRGGMEVVSCHFRLIDQTVRSNRHPLDHRIVLTNLGAQIFGGLLVVRVRRHQETYEKEHTSLGKRDLLVTIVIDVARGVHQDKFDGLLRAVCLRSLAQATDGVGDEPM